MLLFNHGSLHICYSIDKSYQNQFIFYLFLYWWKFFPKNLQMSIQRKKVLIYNFFFFSFLFVRLSELRFKDKSSVSLVRQVNCRLRLSYDGQREVIALV